MAGETASPVPFSDVDREVKGKKSTRRDISEHEARGYKPLCLGNSGQDLAIISMCFLCLWGFLVGYFALLLHAALETTESATALWMYFGFFLFGLFFLSIVLTVSNYEMKKKERSNNSI